MRTLIIAFDSAVEEFEPVYSGGSYTFEVYAYDTDTDTTGSTCAELTNCDHIGGVFPLRSTVIDFPPGIERQVIEIKVNTPENGFI